MKFLAGMFKTRKPAPLAEGPRPKPEPLSPESVARMEQEREEAEEAARQYRTSAEEAERTARAYMAGEPWGSDGLGEGRLSGRSWRLRVLESLFRGWSS